MKHRRNILRSASPWLLAVYFLLSTWAGIQLLATLLKETEGSFHTVAMLFSLLAAGLAETILDRLGHLLGGLLGGMKPVLIRTGHTVLVLEGNLFLKRGAAPEGWLFSVVMVPRKNSKRLILFLYMLGGAMLCFLSAIVSYLILKYSSLYADAYSGSFLAAFVLAGFWTGTFSLLPCYFNYAPNDGLNYLLILRDRKNRDAFMRTAEWLAEYSENKEFTVPEDLSGESVEEELGYEKEEDVISPFRVVYLLRLYERLIWKGSTFEASCVLAHLYDHFDDLTDEQQMLVFAETVFCLCLMNTEESKDLADRLMTLEQEKSLKKQNTPESFRALLMWSGMHDERSKEYRQYRRRLLDSIDTIPFKGVRANWMSMKDSMEY